VERWILASLQVATSYSYKVPVELVEQAASIIMVVETEKMVKNDFVFQVRIYS